MNWCRHATRSLVLAVAVSALAPGTASGAGSPLPSDGTASLDGVALPGGDSRYVGIAAGRDDTVLAAIDTVGGRVQRTKTIQGDFVVPAVAGDGTPGGLSADGKTLVLAQSRWLFPRRNSEFVVFETHRLRRTAKLRLEGDFSFDALSPDGETMFLVEYTSPRDPTQYQVRAYDLDREKLLEKPILDTEEAPSAMRGFPLTRATSPGGRWEYTLYDGGGGKPFIHALDTVEGATVCIGLDTIDGIGPEQRLALEIDPDGSTIELLGRPGQLARVDTATFEVTPTLPAGPSESANGSGSSWWALAAGLAAGLGLLAWLFRRLRARSREGPPPGARPYTGHALGGDDPGSGLRHGNGHARERPRPGPEAAGDHEPAGKREHTRG